MFNRMIKKGLVLGIILLFFGASVMSTAGGIIKENKQELITESDSWWNDDWHFRKQMSIEDASEDYQMMIQVWMEDGYDDVSNGVIDCEDHCNSDFSDIRFIDDDHTTLLSYWIEEIGVDDGDHFAYIWVKTSGSGSIFIYYGNDEASSESNGDDTFVFFDDFLGDDYDHDVWFTTGSAHTWMVSDSLMTMQSTGDPGSQGGHFILKPEASITVPYGHMLYTKLSAFRDPNDWSNSPNFKSWTTGVEDTDMMDMWYRPEGDDHMRTEYNFNGVLGGTDNDISSGSWTDDAWYYFIMESDSNAPYASFQVLKEDRSQWGNKVEVTLEYYDDFSPFEFWYYQRPYSSGRNVIVDWVFVGKYVHSSQSSWNNFGEEQEYRYEIGSIAGGLGVTATIANVGDVIVEDLTWEIHITGGIFGLIDKTYGGTIDDIETDQLTEITSGLFIGLGGIDITVRVNDDEETISGQQIIIFTSI